MRLVAGSVMVTAAAKNPFGVTLHRREEQHHLD